MSRTIVQTDKAPAPIGPYSQAVITGNLVFTSGQIPIDPATGQLNTGTIEEQTRLVMENLNAVLTAADTTFKNVVKSTLFLADMNDFPTINTIYGSYFDETSAPARSTVQVARLPKDVKIEIEVIAQL